MHDNIKTQCEAVLCNVLTKTIPRNRHVVYALSWKSFIKTIVILTGLAYSLMNSSNFAWHMPIRVAIFWVGAVTSHCFVTISHMHDFGSFFIGLHMRRVIHSNRRLVNADTTVLSVLCELISFPRQGTDSYWVLYFCLAPVELWSLFDLRMILQSSIVQINFEFCNSVIFVSWIRAFLLVNYISMGDWYVLYFYRIRIVTYPAELKAVLIKTHLNQLENILQTSWWCCSIQRRW